MTDDSLLITECILHSTHLFYYLKISIQITIIIIIGSKVIVSYVSLLNTE